MCLVKPLRNKQSNSYLLDVGCFFLCLFYIVAMWLLNLYAVLSVLLENSMNRVFFGNVIIPRLLFKI